MSTETTVFYTHLSHYHKDLEAHLPIKERERLGQFSSQSRQQLFTLGRALLTEALTFLTGNGDYQITYLAHGKPILHSRSGCQFNLTHSGAHLFLALRQHHPIGIDSEILRPRAYQRLSQKLFTQIEQDDIANAVDPMQSFYRYWTCYEAQIKYLGLSVFSDLPDEPQRFLASYRYDNLIFSLCSDADIGHIASYRYAPQTVDPFEPITAIPLE